MNEIKKKVLWITWKDLLHPQSGGAELFAHEVRCGLVKQGFEVTVLTSNYPGAELKDSNDLTYIRTRGGKYTQFLYAFVKYFFTLRNKYNIVIEEANTTPYFSGLLYRGKHFNLFHQLAREVWFYETKFPLSYIGYYLLEPVALRIQSLLSKEIITVSESSKCDLTRFGFKEKNIHIVSEGTGPILGEKEEKEKLFTLLYHGSLREMKRPIEIVRSFIKFEKQYPDTQLWISGSGNRDLLEKEIQAAGIGDKVKFWGRVSEEQKFELMRKAHVIGATSIKEGWGIVIIEAGKCGTPAIVYDVDGLRDAVVDGKSGYVVANNNSDEFADKLLLMAKNKDLYDTLAHGALKFNSELTFEKTVKQFVDLINKE